MQLLSAAIRNIVKNEEGATMVEYGLMLALIAVVCIVAVALIGTNANKMFTTIAGSV
ncbi:MAG TPA: Flp family type IVb pilin [Gemmatimonadaceae bacterium]|nr:Flp family type IVb pilin [Gemmatimonadaceae bacterium]